MLTSLKPFSFYLSSVFGSSELDISFFPTEVKGPYLRFPLVITKHLCFANLSSLLH